MKNSYSLRQLFGATLLASMVLALCNAHPILSTNTIAPSAESREPRAVNFYLMRKLELRDSIVRLARAQVGTPYILGGTSREGFDCSGLVQYVYSRVYVTPPRTARQQARIGAPIGREQLQPGDILTFGDAKRVSHIGIYIGDGKFVHASSVAGRVIISPLDRKPHKLIRPLNGARRLFAVAEGRNGGG